MAYRPYPNVDRSLRQLDRHQPPAPAMEMPECLRPMAESFARLRETVIPAPVRYVIGLGRNVGNIRSVTEGEVATLRQMERPGIVGGQP